MARLAAGIVVLVWAGGVAAAAPKLYARVVDVGAGLCVVVQMPGGKYLIYDTGNYENRYKIGSKWFKGKRCFAAVKQLIPYGKRIELLVHSHSDADHVAATPQIAKRYKILRTWRPGVRPKGTASATWKASAAALAKEPGIVDVNLSKTPLPGGTTYTFGKTTVTIVLGYAKPPTSWGLTEKSELNNAGSIVVRITYDKRSILLTGDSVGRHIGDPSSACRAAEQEMVSRAASVPIRSSVLVAAHHGADNGSSTCFIKAVRPRWVIFSAGHKYEHPRSATARRFRAAGVALKRIFRTDRGDGEGGKEWRSQGSNHDRAGDDDVEIVIEKGQPTVVRYKP